MTGGRVLVTGAGGNVGREVVRALLLRGVRVRAADRTPERLRSLFGDRIEAAVLDFRDPASWAVAAGCDRLFLLRPPAIADVRSTLCPFVDEARRRGIGQVVFLSVAGAGRNPLVPHHAVEAHLRRVGGDFTLLRPGFFAQNLQDAYRRDIVEEGRLYVPAGAGRAAFVDLRDVAEVAAQVFTGRRAGPHQGAAYTLTGPAAVSFAEAAEVLTGALGYEVRYVPAAALGYARHLRRRGLPWAQVAVQTVLHVGLRFGQAAQVDATMERLLGRPGHTLAEYVRDHAALWRRGDAGDS